MNARLMSVVVLAVLSMTTPAANAECQQCGHVSRPVYAGMCRACTHGPRPYLPKHGHDTAVQKPRVPAIARFHPVPTRPVFEPRRVAPAPHHSPLPSIEVPSEDSPRVPSPASVLRRSKARTAERQEPTLVPLRAPDLSSTKPTGTRVSPASHAAPAQPARTVRRVFAD